MGHIALITGGTSGIGAAFARRLAAEGSDLVLVARDPDRLEQAAADLTAEFGISVETLRADLTMMDGMALVEARIKDMDKPIDLLVNNAGVGVKGSFVEASVEDHVAMVRINVVALLRLTHAAMTMMTRRNRGDIINISSVAGFVPGTRPSATYAATKSFVTALTEGLATAVAGTGVRISAICPGFVKTEFHERAGIDVSKKGGRMWFDAADVVDVGLKDHRSGKIVSVPGGTYKAIVLLSRIAPRSSVRFFVARFAKKNA
jgi:uncharacterized protein